MGYILALALGFFVVSEVNNKTENNQQIEEKKTISTVKTEKKKV